MNIPTLKTERLLLRPWRPEDLEPFAKINADPHVMEFYASTLTREESDALAEKIQAHFRARGYGYWAVEIPGVAPFIGYIGLNYWDLPMPFAPCVDIGWRLAKEYWGQGFATEGARAALRFGFESLSLKEIVSMATAENKKSHRVMERIGMKFSEKFEHPKVPKGDPLSLRVLYRMQRKNWQAGVHLSAISPVYQAENLIDELVDRLIQSLSKITDRFEIVLVEDGSRDQSWSQIEANCRKDPRVRGIQLSRNFGQHFAITAGIEAARGDWVVVMDCDLQDRPEEIPILYRKALAGYDIVMARRELRQDSAFKRLCSSLFYRLLSFLSGTQYDSAIANFGIYRKNVIGSVLRMKDTIRFFPAMINWVGFRKTTVAVEHAERPRGKSSYNFKKQIKLAVDIILAYSDKPLRLIVGLGVCISFLAFLFSFIIVYRYLKGQVAVLGYASLITSISFFSGVIVSVLGIVGLYIGKIFEGIKNRPTYIIREEIHDKDRSDPV